VRNVLVGKTHMAPDVEGLKMLGIAPDSIIGVHVTECGFEPCERDDGLHPTGRPRPRYDAYLRERGYEAANPWEHWANSGAAADGTAALSCGQIPVSCRPAATSRTRHRRPDRCRYPATSGHQAERANVSSCSQQGL
jgi:hypothetical protein